MRFYTFLRGVVVSECPAFLPPAHLAAVLLDQYIEVGKIHLMVHKYMKFRVI